jgi:outer membrane cobalamin receptor
MFLLSACALCATLAVVPSPSPAPSTSPLPEIAHVFTSDRADTTLKNTARTIYVVTHEQIVRNGYRTIAQALSEVPALEISPFGPIGSSVNFTLRGSTSSEVLVLIDGLPAPGSFSNSVELGNLQTAGVDRIEVVEGGGSTLYGTGAIGGIINVITQRTAQNSAVVRYGSFDDRQVELNTGHVQFSRIVTANNFGLPDGSTRPDVDYESSALHLDAGHRFGTIDAVFRGGITSDHVGAPGPDSFLSPSSRESNLNENADISLSHKSAQSETTLQIGGTNQHIVFSCDPVADPNCFQPQEALSTEGRGDLGARNAVRGANEELLYGIDLSRGVVRSDSGGFAAPPISVNALAQSAAYVQERMDASWGTYYAGLRAERDGSLGGEISPSAGFVAHISGISIKGNVATAFRAPNAAELYFPGFGVPSLRPERAKVADFTVSDAHVLGGASLGWFANRTNDLIEPDPVTFALQQIDHAFIEGLTFNLSTPSFNGFTTSLDITDLYRAQNLDTQTRLPNDPVISSNLRLDYTPHHPNVVDSFGVAIRTSGDRGPVVRTLPLFDQPAAYSNLSAYLRLRAGADALITLRGYNLGNERYAAVSGYPMPGRSFIVELSTK